MDSSWICVGLAGCAFFCSLLGAAVASPQKQAGLGCLLGLLLGPIGVLIAVLVRGKPASALPVSCHSCKKIIQPGDPACPHCGADRPDARGQRAMRKGLAYRTGRALARRLRR